MGHDQLQQMLSELGSVGVMMPAVTLAAGLLLWLLGRKLARPACALSGLVLGGVGGLVLGEAMVDQGGFMLALVIGGAIGGALLAALLFRVWMAISGAVIFGLAASAAVLLWQEAPADEFMPGDAPPALQSTQAEDAGERAAAEPASGMTIPDKVIAGAIEDLTAAATDHLGETIGQAATSTDNADTAPGNRLAIDREVAAEVGSVIVQALRSLAGYYRQQFSAWWDSAGTGAKGAVWIVGLAAAVVGLLLGLIGPYTAASVQSAVTGSVLMLFSAFSLLAQLMPDHLSWLPATPRGVLVCLGLITVLGMVLQWTFFGRKTDN